MEPILIEQLPASRRSLRLAVVSETYPPEINGVALSLSRFVEGLRKRHHDIQLIRPRQRPLASDHSRQKRSTKVLVGGTCVCSVMVFSLDCFCLTARARGGEAPEPLYRSSVLHFTARSHQDRVTFWVGTLTRRQCDAGFLSAYLIYSSTGSRMYPLATPGAYLEGNMMSIKTYCPSRLP